MNINRTMNPPESILENTEDILKACEMAEIGGAPVSDSSFILVTQLASLLLLGKYNHARHLWRRHSTEVFTDCEMKDSEMTTATNTSNTTPAATTTTAAAAAAAVAVANTMTGPEHDLYQFRLLWDAAQPLLQSYFGQTSLLESASHVYRSFQSCADANLYPLSNYALELKGGIRDQMAELMETVYDSVDVHACGCMLGYGMDKDDGGGGGGGGGEHSMTMLDQYLFARGWEKASSSNANEIGLWIPASRTCTSTPTMNMKRKSQGQYGTRGSGKESKINFLSNVVGFMERQRVHL